VKVRIFPLVALVLFTASCVDLSQWWEQKWEPKGTWENPKVPWEQWDRDRAECRVLANEEAERDYAVSQQGGQVGTGAGYSRVQPLTQQLDQYDAEKRERSLFERCMTNRGYRRVHRSKDR